MMVKLVNGAKSATFQCMHIQVTLLTDSTEVEVCPKPQGASGLLSLPRDGEAIFVMNDKGDTTDTYRWPRQEGRSR